MTFPDFQDWNTELDNENVIVENCLVFEDEKGKLKSRKIKRKRFSK